MVTSGEREGRWGKIGVGSKDVQTMYKINNYKDILYNTGNIVNNFIITLNGV